MSTAVQPIESPAGRRPLPWAPIAAVVLVVLALLLAIPMAPAPDHRPRPAAAVGGPAAGAGAAPAPDVRAGATPQQTGVERVAR